MYQSSNFSNDFFSNGILVNDIVYLTLSSGYLCALNVNDGSLLWDRYIGKTPTSPVSFENYLFVGTEDGLIMIDVGWMIEGKKEIGKIVSKPVVSDDNVFVGTKIGDLFAYDIDSGNELWSLNLPGEIYISEPFEDNIFVGSDKCCYKININSGDIEWIFETNGMITSRPYHFNEIVYFGSWDTFLYAINVDDGSLKWKFETGWGIETSPIVSDDFLYFGSCDNKFYAIDSNNGNLEWFFSCKSSVHSSPIVVNNKVFFGSDDGRFYSLEKSSGNIWWSFSPGDTIHDKINYCTTPILSNPINFNDNIIIGANGIIYSLII
jgi:outer membrane protein assembly factor BamB